MKNIDNTMSVFDIRNSVIAKLNENAEEFEGWEINCSLNTFEFGDADYMDNYILYRISNHEKGSSYRFHHQIDENGKHHCWWYNFDTISLTYSDQIAIDEMVSFISNLIRREND